MSPVILQGRLFQCKVIPQKKEKTELITYGWDDPLPPALKPEWESWVASLKELHDLKIPREFYPLSMTPARQELHVFSDASVEAIGYVAYLRTISTDMNVHVAFITSGSMVAHTGVNSVPRLELNAATEAARGITAITSELERRPDSTFMYTDSMVVMGYVNNTHRNFPKYVERQVNVILDHNSADVWHYVTQIIMPLTLHHAALNQKH